eukprot:Skav236146  [mRNA]  locus=scaffold2146:61172:64783:+ [translate_table: standard]
MPAETFEDSLWSCQLLDEMGKVQKFFFFDMPLTGNAYPNVRVARFFSQHNLTHARLLLEPDHMVRREQPAERFKVLCDAEVKKRKETESGKKQKATTVLSLDAMKAKVDAVIATREKGEQEAHEAEKALDVSEALASMPGALCPIHTIESTHVQSPERAKRKATKKVAAKPKGEAPRSSRPRTTKAKVGKTAPAGLPEASEAASKIPGSRHGSDGAFAPHVSESDQHDELANAICQKIGGDGTAVKNLDPARILRGEQLGRTLQGALSACVTNGAVNDYFLHLVSSVPKTQNQLAQVLDVVLSEWQGFEKTGEHAQLQRHVSQALTQVVRTYRGLAALLLPNFGAFGAQSSDVEAISKNKKARTLKSGVAGGPTLGPELEVLELVNANPWWGKALEAYWKFAPKALALQPKLQAAVAEAKAEEPVALTTAPRI